MLMNLHNAPKTSPAVLVTGGAGFIGSHLTRRLVAEGCRVTVIDNLHRGTLANLRDCLKDIRFVKADIRDRAVLSRTMRGVEVVFHLAALSNVIEASANTERCVSTNIEGTASVLRAARAAGGRRLIFSSSREVYGDSPDLPVPETAPLRPKNSYGMSKLAGEMCCAISSGEEIETTILRVANAYGPGDRGRVIPRFLERALSGLPLIVRGGDQILDFVPVEFVVDALLRAGFQSHVPGPVNIGSGQGASIYQLLEQILTCTNSRSKLQVVQRCDIEVTRFVADTTAAARVLGLRMRRSLPEGLRKLISCPRTDNGGGGIRDVVPISPYVGNPAKVPHARLSQQPAEEHI